MHKYCLLISIQYALFNLVACARANFTDSDFLMLEGNGPGKDITVDLALSYLSSSNKQYSTQECSL